MLLPSHFIAFQVSTPVVALPKPLKQLHRPRESQPGISGALGTVQSRPLQEDLQQPSAHQRGGWVKPENLTLCPRWDPSPRGESSLLFGWSGLAGVCAHSLIQPNRSHCYREHHRTSHLPSPRKTKSLMWLLRQAWKTCHVTRAVVGALNWLWFMMDIKNLR